MDLSQFTVKDLSGRCSDTGNPPSDPELELMDSDGRASVRRLASAIRNQKREREAERSRLEAMLTRERLLWESGLSYLAGVDEVGVGPFAGPVVAAAVVFPPEISIEGINDSKKLSPERRVGLDAAIRKHAIGIGIGRVESEEIDQINIYAATLKAMRLALVNLNMRVQHVLVDGRTIPGIAIPQEAIIAGDTSVYSIAAASIVAKVYRDNLMVEYDRLYPVYGFAKHKGYGTEEHIRALVQHGRCAIHRRSFNWE